MSARLTIPGTIASHKAYFLFDTGATVSLISDKYAKANRLAVGRPFKGQLIGAGGSFKTARMCDDIATIVGKQFSQFVIADIDNIVESIKQETGIEIAGIVGLPQMQINNIIINTSKLEVK